MLDMQMVTQILRDQGFKATPQRLAVYEALASDDSHPNAEMLYNMLKEKYPTMSLATVYKTMDIFSAIGLIQVLNVGEDSFRYDAQTDCHPHVRCVSCNRVDDVFEVDDEAMLQEIANKTGYQITGRQLYFFGKCQTCQAKALNKSKH